MWSALSQGLRCSELREGTTCSSPLRCFASVGKGCCCIFPTMCQILSRRCTLGIICTLCILKPMQQALYTIIQSTPCCHHLCPGVLCIAHTCPATNKHPCTSFCAVSCTKLSDPHCAVTICAQACYALPTPVQQLTKPPAPALARSVVQNHPLHTALSPFVPRRVRTCSRGVSAGLLDPADAGHCGGGVTQS